MMKHGVLPLSGTLVTIGFSDLCVTYEVLVMKLRFSIVAVASSRTHRALNDTLFRLIRLRFVMFPIFAKLFI